MNSAPDSSSPRARPSVEAVSAVSDELVADLGALVSQLSSSAPAPSRADLEEIVANPATTLLAARDERGALLGSLTLVLFRTPTGKRAWVEDVVVDQGARKRGVGAALVGEALEVARAAGGRTVDLTSRPSREEANRLYVRLGFAQRQTNVYRYDLDEHRHR